MLSDCHIYQSQYCIKMPCRVDFFRDTIYSFGDIGEELRHFTDLHLLRKVYARRQLALLTHKNINAGIQMNAFRFQFITTWI